MKKLIYLFVLVFLLNTGLFQVKAETTNFSGQTLTIYNVEDYISNGDDDYVDIIANFEKEYNVKVNYYTYDKEYALKELYEYKCDLVATHPKKIRLKYSFNQFVEVGKHYYIKSSPEYRQLTTYPKVFNFYNSIDKNEMLLFKGCGLVSHWFVERFESFLKELTEDEQAICLTFFELLPSYVLIKNQNNILSEEDSELFYKVLLPFLEYVAFAENLEFDFEDKRFNAHQAYDILQVCIKDNFNIVDNYIEDVNLSLEEKEIVLGLKKFIKGPFIVMKHLNDGSVFEVNQNMYLVKGIITPIESMEAIAKTPAVCETILIPFKDVITYFSVLAPYPISIGNNMRKQLSKEYKANKDKIIKSL